MACCCLLRLLRLPLPFPPSRPQLPTYALLSPPPHPTGAKAIEVQIKKRETERQQQARLNSYAYLVSKEAEEAWKPLTNNTPDSSAAAAIRCKYLVPKEGREYEAVARPAYLKTVVPTSAQVGSSECFS